jgi:putative endonuclease
MCSRRPGAERTDYRVTPESRRTHTRAAAVRRERAAAAGRGAAAERAAADFLVSRGWVLIARNFRRRLGELDLVARDGEVLAIVEVRTRRASEFGGAAASVDAAKRRRIVRAAQQLLQQQPALARLRVRFDVIVVYEPDAAAPRIEWLQHAFFA